MSNTTTSSYKVTKTIGIQEGIGATVSGQGAEATVTGDAKVKVINIDHSTKYTSMQKQYNFSASVGGFWSFLTGRASGGVSKQEKEETFRDIVNQRAVDATYHFDLKVTGFAPNVQVDARAYYTYLEITDDQGNTYKAISTQNPASDTGAINKDSNDSTQQPQVINNGTTIEI